MGPGERISWRTLNGTMSGVIEDEQELGYLVRLDNGKYVIVDSKSMISSE